MISSIVLLALTLAQPATAELAEGANVPDGSHLKSGQACYRMTREGAIFGYTRQTVRESDSVAGPAWDIVVEQMIPARDFVMTDHFLLRRDNLRPVAFDSTVNGHEHVRLVYTSAAVTGLMSGEDGVQDIAVALPDPVWEGNLWGLTFGALDWSENAAVALPFYQHRLGAGQFNLRVVGSETVATPSGPVDAWRIEAGTDPDRTSIYLIDKADGAELGYSGGGVTQAMLPDCTELATATGKPAAP